MWRSVPPSSCRCSRKYSVLAKLETSFFCVGGEGNSRRVCACERECVCVAAASLHAGVHQLSGW